MGKSKDKIFIIRFLRLNCIKCLKRIRNDFHLRRLTYWWNDRVLNPWLLGNRKHQHRHICQVVWWQNRIHNQSNRDNLRTKSRSHFQQKCDLFRFQPIKSSDPITNWKSNLSLEKNLKLLECGPPCGYKTSFLFPSFDCNFAWNGVLSSATALVFILLRKIPFHCTLTQLVSYVPDRTTGDALCIMHFWALWKPS